MKKLTKFKKIVFSCLSLALIVIVSVMCILPNFINSKNQTLTRNVDVESLGTLSYEEKVEKYLEKFDDYEISTTDNFINFEATIDMSSIDISPFGFLSTNAQTTTKKYATRFDIENERFYVVTKYIQDDEVVYSEELETIPYYDDYMDDYYIQMPDGSYVSVYETLSDENMDECLVLTATAITTAELAILLATVVIIAAPAITSVVTWVKSFWSWFKSLWTAKTVTKTTTVVTTTISYTISIANTKVEAKKFDTNKKYEEGQYYIAIADIVDGFLYVTDNSVDDITALAILTTSTYVSGATKNKNGVFPQLVVSLYTPNGYDAYLIAVEAGTILGDPGAIHHLANKTGYFNHYHPGSVYTTTSKPHVFYGSAA
jgi:hypothetical protein